MAEFSTVALQACTKQADQLRAYLQNQVRLDGRGLVDHRKTLIRKSQFEFGDVVGSSRVQVGGTIIICGINLLVGTPCLAHPSSGDVVCDVTLCPTSLISTEQRSKPDSAYELEECLYSVLTGGSLIDLEQLNIVSGRFAYRLCVNITCLSSTGNLMDAIIFAAIAALQDVKLPAAVVRDDKVMIDEGNTHPLFLTAVAVPVTMGVFEGRCLVDPSDKEEALIDGRLLTVWRFPIGVDSMQDETPSMCLLRQSSEQQNGWTALQVEEAVKLCAIKAQQLKTLILT